MGSPKGGVFAFFSRILDEALAVSPARIYCLECSPLSWLVHKDAVELVIHHNSDFSALIWPICINAHTHIIALSRVAECYPYSDRTRLRYYTYPPKFIMGDRYRADLSQMCQRHCSSYGKQWMPLTVAQQTPLSFSAGVEHSESKRQQSTWKAGLQLCKYH